MVQFTEYLPIAPRNNPHTWKAKSAYSVKGKMDVFFFGHNHSCLKSYVSDDIHVYLITV